MNTFNTLKEGLTGAANTLKKNYIILLTSLSLLQACGDKNEVGPNNRKVEVNVIKGSLTKSLEQDKNGILGGGTEKDISTEIPEEYTEGMTKYRKEIGDSLKAGLSKILLRMKQDPLNQYTIRKDFLVKAIADSIQYTDPDKQDFFENYNGYGGKTMKGIVEQHISKYPGILSGAVDHLSSGSTAEDISEIVEQFTVTFNSTNQNIPLDGQFAIIEEAIRSGKDLPTFTTFYVLLYVANAIMEDDLN